MIGIGLGLLGIDSEGLSDILWDADYTTLSPGGMASSALLAARGTTFTRGVNGGAASETVQTSDQTVLATGLTTNVARIGQFGPDAATRGLVIEIQNSNQIDARSNMSFPAVPFAGDFNADGSDTAPDGTSITNAHLHGASGQAGPTWLINSGNCVFSCWARGVNYQCTLNLDNSGWPQINGTLDPVKWQRLEAPVWTFSNYFLCISNNKNRVATGGDGPTDHDSSHYFVQVESANGAGECFATEVILGGTRPGENVNMPTASKLVDVDGRANIRFSFIPKGASTAYASILGTTRLITFGGSDHVDYNPTTHKFSVTVNGSTWTTTATASWPAKALVEVFVCMGGGTLNTTLKYRVRPLGQLYPGAVVDMGDSGSPQAVLAPGGGADFMCAGTGSQLSCWLQRVTAYKTGKGPTWANRAFVTATTTPSTTSITEHETIHAVVTAITSASVVSTDDEEIMLDTIGHRLTLTTGVPVTTTDVTAASTLYLTPDKSGAISLYTAGSWKQIISAEVSLALTGLTSGFAYDVFVWNNSGVATLELSAAWADDVTMTDALARQDGVWVKSSDHTRRHVGTIRTTGTTTTECSEAKMFVWNRYNQRPRKLKRVDSTSAWADTNTSWRPANNNAANCVEYISGDAATEVRARLLAPYSGNNLSDVMAVGVGIDSTSVNSADLMGSDSFGTFAPTTVTFATLHPGFGYHKLTWLEHGGSSGQFYGQVNSNAAAAAGMLIELEA